MPSSRSRGSVRSAPDVLRRPRLELRNVPDATEHVRDRQRNDAGQPAEHANNGFLECAATSLRTPRRIRATASADVAYSREEESET